jgi:hypothetical protein
MISEAFPQAQQDSLSVMIIEPLPCSRTPSPDVLMGKQEQPIRLHVVRASACARGAEAERC